MRARTPVAANLGLLVGAVLAGASVVATRSVVRDVPPLSLAVLRYAQGGLLLAACLVVVAPGQLVVRRRDLPYLALLGVLLFAAFPLAFNLGLQHTEASRGSLMLATVPVWSALLARASRREQLTFRQSVGVALSLTGVAVAVADRGIDWESNAGALAGDGLLLLAALCGAAYGVLSKRAFTRYSAMTVTTYGMLCGTVALVPAALVEGLPSATSRLEGRTLLLVLFLGILGGAVLWYLFAYGLSKLMPTQVAVYINLNPLTALILGAAFLDERLTAPLIVSLVIVITGVVLVNWPARARAAPPGRTPAVAPRRH